MTNTTTDAAEAWALTVIQADRDAAAKAYFNWTAYSTEEIRDEILAGLRDEGVTVQAFARHRLATAEAASGAGEREGSQPPKPSWCGCYPDPVDGLDYICDRHLELGVPSLPSLPGPTIDQGGIIALIDPVLKQAEQSGKMAGLWLFADQWRTVRAALAAAPTIPATGAVYDGTILDTDATIPATGHAATEGEGGVMDDFDREIARIHRRRMVPSLIFSSDTAVVLIIVLLIWFLA